MVKPFCINIFNELLLLLKIYLKHNALTAPHSLGIYNNSYHLHSYLTLNALLINFHFILNFMSKCCSYCIGKETDLKDIVFSKVTKLINI